jgi:hypothetical protein
VHHGGIPLGERRGEVDVEHPVVLRVRRVGAVDAHERDREIAQHERDRGQRTSRCGERDVDRAPEMPRGGIDGDLRGVPAHVHRGLRTEQSRKQCRDRGRERSDADHFFSFRSNTASSMPLLTR